MKKIIFIILSLFAVSNLYAGKGKIRIASEKEGAYIYVNDKKKAMTGEGFTSILLEEGEYVIKVIKPIDEKYEYVEEKKIFVGEETSSKIKFNHLVKKLTAQGKILQAKADAPKLARWKYNGHVVIDSKLGLIWQDNTDVKQNKKNWYDAKQYCRNLTLNGYVDWRLPTYHELLSIVDYDRYKPALMPSFKHVNTSTYYWSSSLYKSKTDYILVVAFSNGKTNYNSKKNEYYSRCIHDNY